MRILITGLAAAIAATLLAVHNEPAPERLPSKLRDNPPVVDADGYLVRWADRTPAQIYEMNVQRRALGKAKGPIPGF